jgi:hypothetical protein
VVRSYNASLTTTRANRKRKEKDLLLGRYGREMRRSSGLLRRRGR